MGRSVFVKGGLYPELLGVLNNEKYRVVRILSRRISSFDRNLI